MFEERLKLERNRIGLTQSELGKMMGVSQQAIGKWEKGIAEPDISSINKLSDIFQCNPNYLLGNVTDRTPINEKNPDQDIVLDEIRYALFGEVRDLTDEEIEELVRNARRMNEIRKLKDKGNK